MQTLESKQVASLFSLLMRDIGLLAIKIKIKKKRRKEKKKRKEILFILTNQDGSPRVSW